MDNVFEAEIKTQILMRDIDAISVINDECRIHIVSDGLYVKTVNKDNVALIDIMISEGDFESYNRDENTGEFGINIKQLKKVLAMFDKKGTIKLTLSDDGKELYLKSAQHECSLLTVDTNVIKKDPNPPSSDLPAVAVVSGKELNTIIKAISSVSKYASFGFDGETFYIRSEWSENKINFNPLPSVYVATSESPRSSFNCTYLKGMTRVLGKCKSVAIHFGKDSIVVFTSGKLNYYLAPRVEA